MSELPFKTEDLNLYEILNLDKSATKSEIKTSYKKLALRFHPDKLSINATETEKRESNERFQQIGLAYQILNDSNSRKSYDLTGSLHFNSTHDGNWNDYFKELWSGEVNSKSIEEFTKSYQGSEEEINDIKEHYTRFEGIIDNLIKSQELPKLTHWIKTKSDEKAAKKRRLIANRESREAEILSKELGLNEKLSNKDSKDSEEALKALILSNSKNRHQMMIQKLESKARQDDLESQSKRKKSKRKEMIEDDQNQDEIKLPDEDEFLKLQAEIESRKHAKKGSEPSTSKQTSNQGRSLNLQSLDSLSLTPSFLFFL
ncbi:DnaJ domain-containing protein [Melampsora americana]|nr:DnaJ domain-containing protein [Melampsora americana]